MTFKDKITFFYALEEKLWNENVEANKYFGTLCVLFVALVGALNSVGGALQSMLDVDAQPSVYASVALCLFVWGLNVAESIVACTNALTALKRSLLMLVVLLAACVAGIVLGGIIVAIVCIILFILFCVFLISMLTGSMNASLGGKRKWKTEDGETVHGEKAPGSDIVHGDDGRDYKIKDPWGM